MIYELQFAGCNNPRFSQWRKCVHCTAKAGGDSCRFVHFRAFPVDPVTDKIYPFNANRSDLQPAFVSSPDPDDVMVLPKDRPLPSSDLLEAQANVSKSLLPVLDTELLHAQQKEVLRRPRETTCRQMCEFCATSIFSASWFCRRCGREYCPDCKHALQDPDPSEPALTKRLALCDKSHTHSIANLIPLTRFDVALLEQEVVVMRGMLASSQGETNAQVEQSQELTSHQAAEASKAEPSQTSLDDDDKDGAAVDWSQITQEQCGLTADKIIGSHQLRIFDSASFSTDTFRREWSHANRYSFAMSPPRCSILGVRKLFLALRSRILLDCTIGHGSAQPQGSLSRQVLFHFWLR